LGLGQAVRTQQVTTDHVGQPALTLLAAAVRGQRVTGQHMHADALRHGQPCGRQFLDDLQVHHVRLSAAAILLRVGQAE
jgi:hypothetical protein